MRYHVVNEDKVFISFPFFGYLHVTYEKKHNIHNIFSCELCVNTGLEIQFSHVKMLP